jgi:hypothetical protein
VQEEKHGEVVAMDTQAGPRHSTQLGAADGLPRQDHRLLLHRKTHLAGCHAQQYSCDQAADPLAAEKRGRAASKTEERSTGDETQRPAYEKSQRVMGLPREMQQRSARAEVRSTWSWSKTAPPVDRRWKEHERHSANRHGNRTKHIWASKTEELTICGKGTPRLLGIGTDAPASG